MHVKQVMNEWTCLLFFGGMTISSFIAVMQFIADDWSPLECNVFNNFNPEEAKCHINILEVVKAIWIAKQEWKEMLRGQNLIIYTDSMVALSVIKKGSAKSPLMNRIVISIWRTIFEHNIQLLSLEWLPSAENEVADQLGLNRRGRRLLSNQQLATKV